MKMCWLDVRALGEECGPVLEEAVHQRVDAVLAADRLTLTLLPPTMTRVLYVQGDAIPGGLDGVDILILDAAAAPRAADAALPAKVEFGTFVHVTDADSLDRACASAASGAWTVIEFADPTKIPLEIVLAAAAHAEGRVITAVRDLEEAAVVFGVLERGADGVLLAPRRVGDATALRAVAETREPDLGLAELRVQGIRRVGMGERVCVDTCSYLAQNEGILVGSHSHALLLCVSETHPLPYMPTRPFRVNAGALHSYTMSASGRTRYLSELGSGSRVLAVDVAGHCRLVAVGRVKIESRPLLSIDAVGAAGRPANLIVQDDWHVRLLGPDAAVLNVTELQPGDVLLGYLPTSQRHVGYAIDEFCIEK